MCNKEKEEYEYIDARLMFPDRVVAHRSKQCGNCRYRFCERKHISTIVFDEYMAFCEKFIKGKPADILFDGKECEYYEPDDKESVIMKE